MDEPCLVDTLRPPDGYRAVASIWLTHDLDTQAITEVALPAMLGCVARERITRLRSLADAPPGLLTVAYAADRMRTCGITPNAPFQMLPVSGRRQHAKLIVIRFEREAAAGGPRVVWRAIVTSGNATQGGLRVNREVYGIDEAYSNQRRVEVSWTVSAREAIEALSADLDPAFAKPLLKQSRRVFTDLPANLRPAHLAHSLAGQQSMLDPLDGCEIRHLFLCAPTFAAKGRQVATRLSAMVMPATRVTIAVPLGPRSDGRVPVPKGLINAFKARGCQVEVLGVPEIDGEGRSRRLHGKQITAVLSNGTGLALFGSANLTKRGLEGENRELMALVTDENGDSVLEAWRDGLEARSIQPDLWLEQPTEPELPATVGARPLMTIEFHPIPGQTPGGTTRGVLRGAKEIEAVRVDGKVVELGQEVTVSRDSEVRVRADGKWHPAVLVIAGDEAGFWGSAPRDDLPPPEDAWLRRLLGDIDRARRENTTARGPAVGERETGRFDVPMTLWLNLVARYRSRLAFEGADVAELVLERFSSDEERAVALAVLASIDTLATDRPPRQDPLLTALTAHLETLDLEEGR